MEHSTLQLLNEVNRSIIKFRGLYAQWSGEHGISYHEMLVLYTIREKGFCTQKQICDSYIIPRQTMHNVIGGLRREGILAVSEADSVGREKAFVLTEKGEGYAAPLLEALERMERVVLDNREKSTADIVELLGKEGFDRAYGARPIRRLIRREVEDPIAEGILAGRFAAGGSVRLAAGENGLAIEGGIM